MLRACNGMFIRCCLYSFPLLASLAALTLLSACNQRPSPELRRRVESQLYSCAMDASDFAPGWRLIRSETYDVTSRGIPGNGLGGIQAVFGRQGPSGALYAIHAILAYSTPERATVVFGRSPDVFHDALRLTPWLGFDVTQAGLSTDVYRVGCAYFDTYDADISRKRCHYLGQYGRFLTTFTSDVFAGYISEEEVVQVWQAIDKRMLQCVNTFGEAVWEEEIE